MMSEIDVTELALSCIRNHWVEEAIVNRDETSSQLGRHSRDRRRRQTQAYWGSDSARSHVGSGYSLQIG
jgi:hypothetical protein